MEWRNRRIEEVLRDADVAGLLQPSDVERLASAVAHEPSHRAGVPLMCPGGHCYGCGSVCQPRLDKAVGATVLGVGGLHTRRHIPIRCRSASCRWRDKHQWHNFGSLDRGCYEWQGSRPEDVEHVMLTPTFGVTWEWYSQFNRRLLRHYSSFWGEAHVHVPAGAERLMSPDRLQVNIRNAWFKITLLRRRFDMGLVTSMRLDTPASVLIEEFFVAYDTHMQSRRVAQLSSMGSLAELARVVVVDGNQKLTRRVCAELCAGPARSVPDLGLRCLLPCSQKPQRGSAFCHEHTRPKDMACLTLPDGSAIHHVRCKAPVAAEETELMDVSVTMLDGTRKYVPLAEVPRQICRAAIHVASLLALPGAPASSSVSTSRAGNPVADSPAAVHIDDSTTLAELAAVSCQTHKMSSGRVAKRRRVEADVGSAVFAAAAPPTESSVGEVSSLATRARRSGGFLVACASNGIVLDVVEFYGAESLPQRYFFTARLRHLLGEALRVIVHDDACHLRRFAEKRRNVNAFAASLAFPRITYVVDRFHARGHVDKWCLENCHPDAPAVQGMMDGIKSSICESTNNWFGRYKHMARKMDRWACNFFLVEVIDLHNADMVARLGKSSSHTSSSDSSSSDDGGSSAATDGTSSK